MDKRTRVRFGVEKWFRTNGYAFRIERYLKTKTVYSVTKSKHTEIFELPVDVIDVAGYMRLFEIQFKLSVGIAALEREAI